MFVSGSVDQNRANPCLFLQRYQQSGSKLGAQDPRNQDSCCQVGPREPSPDATSSAGSPPSGSRSAARLPAAARSCPASVSAASALYAAPCCLRQAAGPQRRNRDRQYLRGGFP